MSTTTPPERDLPDTTRALSVWEQEIYHKLVQHADSEVSLIGSYRELADTPETPEPARFLIRLVIEDEERHHRLLRQIAIALGNGVAWRDEGDAVPHLAPGRSPPRLRRVTRQFLDAEREDGKQLRELRKALRPVRDTTLWPLLLGLMERDTEKHVMLLTFIADHLA